jgi:hypothetical protein
MFMIHRRHLLLTLAFIAPLLGACANMDTVRNASLEDARSRAFNASFERTNSATLKALASMNVDITESSENAQGTTYMVNKALTAFSWGEVGRVLVKKSDAAPTTVYVNWEKRSRYQITGTNQTEFSETLFAQIGDGLTP